MLNNFIEGNDLMKEIEIAVELKQSIDDVKAKLKNFTHIGKKHTLDVYFYDEKKDNLKPDENLRLYQCFRIRKRENKSYMTYKVDKFEGNTWIYSEEDEIEVSDFDVAHNIVKRLGLTELIRIDYYTDIYVYDDYEIVVENVQNLGFFLEVEKLRVPDETSYEDVKLIKDDIRKFIESLEIEFVELNDGKPELMLKKIKVKA